MTLTDYTGLPVANYLYWPKKFMQQGITSKEVKQLIGKKKAFGFATTVNLFIYAGGLEAFDDRLEVETYFSAPNIADLTVRKTGLQVTMMHHFKQIHAAIPFDEIKGIHLEDKEQIYEQKEKSVVGRAVVGGLLFGGLGAIVGGMTGAGTRSVKAEMPDLVLTIELTDRAVLLACKYEDKGKAKTFLKTYLGALYNE